jgi:monoamine oxidase
MESELDSELKAEIIVVGAGSAGLMAGYMLGSAGKKVLVLEARDRIGGRVYPLSVKDFDYPAEGGAEYVHGEAPLTRSLILEAHLQYESIEGGVVWGIYKDKLIRNAWDPNNKENVEIYKYKPEFTKKLSELQKDVSIGKFIEENFSQERYKPLVNWIKGMVEGYDIAEMEKISCFSLRQEWLSETEKSWKQGRIMEGYGALTDYLYKECKSQDITFSFETEINEVELKEKKVIVRTLSGKEYFAEKIILTLPLPVLKKINFIPELSEDKKNALDNIGYGDVIKVLFRFNDYWWHETYGQDFSDASFIQTNNFFSSIWTQYPKKVPVLTGWISGPNAIKSKEFTDSEIIKLGLLALSEIFQTNLDLIEKSLKFASVFNWPKDKYTLGAYSYSTVGSERAYVEMKKPIEGKIYFAGEAFCSGKDTATVEGALKSGKEVAKIILNI